jgi:hypothetical protein
MDSSFVACALILRVPRGPRRPGVRTAGELFVTAGCAAAVGWSALSEGSRRDWRNGEGNKPPSWVSGLVGSWVVLNCEGSSAC